MKVIMKALRARLFIWRYQLCAKLRTLSQRIYDIGGGNATSQIYPEQNSTGRKI